MPGDPPGRHASRTPPMTEEDADLLALDSVLADDDDDDTWRPSDTENQKRFRALRLASLSALETDKQQQQQPQQQQQQQEEEGEEEEEKAEEDPLPWRRAGQERLMQIRAQNAATSALALQSAHRQERLRGFGAQFRRERQLGRGGPCHYAANFDLIYRSQLRYWHLVRRLHLRRLFPEAPLPSPPPPDSKEAALSRLCLAPHLIADRVRQKALTVHATQGEQVRSHLVQHLINPDDYHWMAYVMPTISQVPQSVMERLHPERMNQMVEESEQPMLSWLRNPDPRRRAFRDWIAVELWDKVLPPQLAFSRRFVTTLDRVERDLPLLSGQISAWPRLLQQNGRFVCLYRGHVQQPSEGSVYDVLALWLRLVALHFSHTRLWHDLLLPFLKNESKLQQDRVHPLVYL